MPSAIGEQRLEIVVLVADNDFKREKLPANNVAVLAYKRSLQIAGVGSTRCRAGCQKVDARKPHLVFRFAL